MLEYTLPDGRKLYRGQSFTLNGISYPKRWLEFATENDLEALGITVSEIPDPEPEPYEPTLEDYQFAIQAHIDRIAQERQYDDGKSCATYVNSTVPQWAAEAQAFVTWRDSVWLYAFQELAKVEQGLREQPDIEDFIDELPVMVWPEENEL